MKPIRFALAVLAGTLACGVPLWPLSYREVEFFENPHPLLWLALGASAGILSTFLLRPSRALPVLAVTLGFVAAVYGRVQVETAKDPTSHNLWPFEVVIAGGFGLVAGTIGVAIARRFERRPGPPA